MNKIFVIYSLQKFIPVVFDLLIVEILGFDKKLDDSM